MIVIIQSYLPIVWLSGSLQFYYSANISLAISVGNMRTNYDSVNISVLIPKNCESFSHEYISFEYL